MWNQRFPSTPPRLPGRRAGQADGETPVPPPVPPRSRAVAPAPVGARLLTLTPAQVRNRLIIAARHIVADHWPRPGGRCPVCRVADCDALRTALTYLMEVDDQARREVLELMRRGACRDAPAPRQQADAPASDQERHDD